MHKGKPKPARTNVSVIGAGRLGTALAASLAKGGYKIEALVCRSARNARRAAKLVGSGVPLKQDQLDQLPRTDLILISTPDDVISDTAAALALSGINFEDVTVLHTSGALSSKVLQPLKERGAHTGSLHPLISISDPLQSAKMFSNAFFCLEGDRKAVSLSKRIVKQLGGESFSITPDKKPLYHASAVMCAGHTVALLDIAVEMLSHCGITTSKAERILLPLIHSTLANVDRSGRSASLTGTFSRGDIATVKEHLRVIEAEPLVDAQTVYRLLGRRSIKLSPTLRKKPEVAEAINRLLNQLEQ